jgi:hypothetical protein
MRRSFFLLALALAVDFGCGRTAVLVSSDIWDDSEVWDIGNEPDSDSPEGEAICLHDSDCKNGLVCDGQERCMDGACVPGEPLICSDGNDCTIDSCSEEEGGCLFTPRDLDDDGFGDATCGGADCDDTRNDVFPGAPGSCNEGEDLNCTGTPDLDDDQDGHVDADCPGGDDCDDNDPDTYPGATELCLDGKDQDCDGIVDGPMLMSSSVRISDQGSGAMTLSMAWTGSEFGIAWDGISFTRVSAEGEEIGQEEIVSACYDPPSGCYYSDYPSMAWTGSEFVLAYRGIRNLTFTEIYFTRLTARGMPAGDEVRETFSDTLSDEKFPSLAWSGSVLGLTWHHYTQDVSPGEWHNYIYFKEIYPTGEDATSEAIIDENARGKHPQLAWTGSEFGVVWYCEDICFSRISAGGDMVGEIGQVLLSGDISLCIPPPAWTGSEFGIIWQEERITESFDQIYYARINSHGEKVGEDIMFSDPMVTSRNPQIAWTGSEIGAAWVNADTDVLIFHRADPTGEAINNDPELAEATPGSHGFPMDIVWTGSEMGVVWVWTPFDSRNGTYFNRIGFCD